MLVYRDYKNRTELTFDKFMSNNDAIFSNTRKLQAFYLRTRKSSVIDQFLAPFNSTLLPFIYLSCFKIYLSTKIETHTNCFKLQIEAIVCQQLRAFQIHKGTIIQLTPFYYISLFTSCMYLYMLQF